MIEQVHKQHDGWDEFVVNHPNAKAHHLSVFQNIIKETFGHNTIYLLARDNQTVTGVLPLVHMKSRLFGNFMVSIPYFNYGGVCAKDDDARRALLDHAVQIARKKNATHIELRHVDEQYGSLPSKSHKVCMLLDLPATADALWKSFKSKLRSQIRRPEKEGVTIKIGRSELLDDFYHVFTVNMRDLGTPVYSKQLFANVMKAFPESSWIVAAYKDNTPLAAGFLLGFRDTLEIPWASSIRKYNRLAANMLMYWHALQLAIHEGYQVFDFGRSSPDSGTFKFKAQWGAEPLALNWEYWMANGGPLPDISPNNSKYQLAIRLWQKVPLPITQIIGPAIVKNIP